MAIAREHRHFAAIDRSIGIVGESELARFGERVSKAIIGFEAWQSPNTSQVRKIARKLGEAARRILERPKDPRTWRRRVRAFRLQARIARRSRDFQKVWREFQPSGIRTVNDAMTFHIVYEQGSRWHGKGRPRATDSNLLVIMLTSIYCDFSNTKPIALPKVFRASHPLAQMCQRVFCEVPSLRKHSAAEALGRFRSRTPS